MLPSLEKNVVRHLHSQAVAHKRDRSMRSLAKHEDRLLNSIASGQDIDVQGISPTLVEVFPRSEEELLFRYAALHWSIPISSGYGRRLRFLVVDQRNNKLIGIIGLGDPVFNLGPRDRWVGWGKESVRKRLRHVMDLFVLGAVPPYSFLLCGKLVALLASSNEVRDSFFRKYSGRRSLISDSEHDGTLALLTTTSALGRSSIYNRLTIYGSPAYISVGSTAGYGDFQFSNGLYTAISDYALKNLTPSAKHSAWGTGFRNRREVVRKVLSSIELSRELLNHGVRRESFVIPLAENTCAFLKGEEAELRPFHRPITSLFSYFRERWLIPRSTRDERYKQWVPEEWRLWNRKG